MRGVTPTARRAPRRRTGAFASVRAVLLKAAGSFTSYRIRVHVRRAGTYRVYVGSTYLSRGASVAVNVRVHR